MDFKKLSEKECVRDMHTFICDKKNQTYLTFLMLINNFLIYRFLKEIFNKFIYKHVSAPLASNGSVFNRGKKAEMSKSSHDQCEAS